PQERAAALLTAGIADGRVLVERVADAQRGPAALLRALVGRDPLEAHPAEQIVAFRVDRGDGDHPRALARHDLHDAGPVIDDATPRLRRRQLDPDRAGRLGGPG